MSTQTLERVRRVLVEEPTRPARRFLWRNGLSLFFGVLFLVALVGEALTGLAAYNEGQVAQGLQQISLGHYLLSSSFAVDVAENWQSEYLQFFLYVMVTVWLVQKGSPESKELDKAGSESDEEQKVGRYAGVDSPSWAKVSGPRRSIYS